MAVNKKTVTKKVKRMKLDRGNYFVSQSSSEFIGSGCAVLDSILGGGWALGRIANIVGDRSSGKTLLAMEACSTFHKKYPEGRIFYLEAESAFDKEFAKALGMPIEAVTFLEDISTVEKFHAELEEAVAASADEPAIFIVDSLDALSDEAEMDRSIEKGSYGAEKAKKMSELFRRLVKKVEKSRLLLVIISQVRDKIGVTFGKKTTRSGGRALDFYASQVLYLAEVGKIYKTVKGIKRPIGVSVKGKVEKNKVGLPFRECQFDILFGYGIDSLTSNLNYLVEVKAASGIDKSLASKAAITTFVKKTHSLSDVEYRKLEAKVSKLVRSVWKQTESQFLPTRRKY